ncbi:TPA: hypothetical protein ACVO32_004407 [Vibrio diabolicus]
MEYYREVVELLGGVTLVLGGLFAFISKIWLSRIIERNKSDLAIELKKLEQDLTSANQRLDAQLQHSVFVSQVQFDKEYRIYGDAWELLVELKIVTSQLRPIFDHIDPSQSEEERKAERYNQFIAPFNAFSTTLEKNKPFFSESVYAALIAVRNACYDESVDYKYGKSADRDYYEKAVENNRNIGKLVDLACEAMRLRLNEVQVK